MKRREFTGLAVTENLTQLPSRTFPAGGLPDFVPLSRCLDAQLDRLTEARGNEVSFRAFRS
jgi:hypothetical protein